MRVLLTGSEGKIGRSQRTALEEAGWEVRTLDRVEAESPAGDHSVADLRDAGAVRKAVKGMDAVAHLGAIPGDWPGHDIDIMQINVQGTWNVLQACMEEGVGRVVAFSSIQALGNVCGHRDTLYFPIGDDYPRHPMSAYQLSKHVGEEMCKSFTARCGMVTVCLRPVGVHQPGWMDRWQTQPPDHTASARVTNYWAYVDVRDVCQATILGLTAENITHDAFLLAADDTAASLPTAELIAHYYPTIPWKTPREEYLAGRPFRSPVDTSHARQTLGWKPAHAWREGGRAHV